MPLIMGRVSSAERGEEAGETVTAPAPKVKEGPFGICAVSGLPAIYKDPVTGQGYANVAAFKELRRIRGGDVTSAESEASAPKGPLSHSDALARLSLLEKVGVEGVVEALMFQKQRTWGLGGAGVL